MSCRHLRFCLRKAAWDSRNLQVPCGLLWACSSFCSPGATAADVIDVLESHEDGLYGPGESTLAPALVSDVLDVSKVNAARYREIQAEMEIDLICDLPKTLRVIDSKHVVDLKNDIKRLGFLTVGGKISVALKQDPRRSIEEIAACTKRSEQAERLKNKFGLWMGGIGTLHWLNWV